jgi:predicted dehydrogenase
VVALCDVDEEHLAFGAKRFPNAKTYVDWRQCLEQKDINAQFNESKRSQRCLAQQQGVRDH